jgi:nitrile hydratase accessory protein
MSEAVSKDAAEAFGQPEHEPTQPWQIKLMAIIVEASKAGLFSWREWVACLSREIKRAPQDAQEGESAAYYRQVLAAFNTILVDKGVLDAAALEQRTRDWLEAVRRTPFGHAVSLDRLDHDHDHHDDDHHDHHGHDHHHDHGDHHHDHPADIVGIRELIKICPPLAPA